MRTPRRLAVTAALLSLLGFVSTAIVGCGANNAPAATATPPAKNLFEYDYDTNTIDEFSLSATGTPVATAALALPSTFQLYSVTQDPTGKIYLAGGNKTTNGFQVLVFAAGATSFSTPTATVNMASTVEPDYIAADSLGNVYVCGTGSTYYEYNVSGSVIRMLTQPAFTSGCDSAMAVDTAGNFYISGYNGTTNLNEIDEVPATAPSGNITPSRTLTFSSQTFPGALNVDSTGNLYAALETFPYTTGTSIEVFSATGSTPTRTINVPAQPAGFSQETSSNVAVDSAGYVYLQVENFNPPTFNAITNPFYGFAPGATTPSISFNLPGDPYGYFFVQ